MSQNLPKTAIQMRELLVRFLDQSKGYMTSDKDKTWIQAEIERYQEQTQLLREGIKRETKHTGIKRMVDELGRVVIPMEMRKEYDIPPYTPLEIFLDEEKGMIVLQKYEPGCNICGELHHDMTLFHGKRFCENCLSELFTMTE